MPDPNDTTNEAVVFTAGAAKLDDATIARLRDEYGLELRVRSSHAAVSDALRGIGDVAVVYFDKTSPGYDKVFDKTSPGSQVMDVVNPVDLAVRVQDIERRIGRPVQ
jgi:hypothetical protein